MTTVYLIRHGQSEGNERHVYCGWTNLPLTKTGVEQVHRLSHSLPDPKPYHVVSSDLTRASETARILAESWNLTITVEKDFREMHFGAFENRTWQGINDKYPALTKQWMERWFHEPTPDGESLEDLYRRVIPLYRSYLAIWKDTCWCLAAHSGVIQAILATEIAGSHEAHWRFAVDNASLIRLDYNDDGYAFLKGFNLTSHCAGSPVKI